MQLEFFDVPSPCIGICQSNDKGQCLGCFRTRAERQTWTSIDSDEKQKIIKRAIQRKKRIEKKENSKDNSVEKSIESNIVQPSLLDPPSKKTLDTSNDFDFDDFEL
ncbi:DUF1289 domain-containing protein [Pseudocolwellia sp. AS88]|jgi:predicted Fe-S protein YdhL (DUF1289 family)|uniref:DUF1289 domain-containing protein n=1 Tax=Pseudocolwellia TaxID=2848177 RepID=UPI0026E99782|nr:DUF1289 domain-containing protein [Pseudocolwellia sp. AS88]MDO7085431.1 DUF1289 domain-containing protein [Pseudocolwellia sp. AS88]